MRDLICDIINYCASSIDIRKINVYFEIAIINLTADKRRKSFPSKSWRRIGIHSMLRRTDAKGCTIIIYLHPWHVRKRRNRLGQA